jgi:hypothetical protein
MRWLWCLVIVAAGVAGCSSPTPQLSPAVGPSAVEQAVKVPSEEELGVPYYPGAKPLSGANTSDLVDGQFATRDSIDKVVSFYKGNIRNAVATGDKNESLIEFERDGDKYSISLHREQRDGVTLISVNRHK